MGGGTDLYVQKPDSLQDLDLNFISNDPELNYIHTTNGICTIGGGTTVQQMMDSELFQDIFPSLLKHFKLISSTPIRSISTIGGNFVNASPIGDLTIFFLALDAQLTLTNKDGTRSLDLKDFFLGYKELDKKNDAHISSIHFQVPSKGTYFNFEKVSKRTHLDIATVNTAILVKVTDNIITKAQLSAGGIAPIPAYLKKTSAFLEGSPLNSKILEQANTYMQSEIKPISDVRGSEHYKRLLLRQLFYAHFIELFPEQISLKKLV